MGFGHKCNHLSVSSTLVSEVSCVSHTNTKNHLYTQRCRITAGLMNDHGAVWIGNDIIKPVYLLLFHIFINVK